MEGWEEQKSKKKEISVKRLMKYVKVHSNKVKSLDKKLNIDKSWLIV